jgi:hypothetical protein
VQENKRKQRPNELLRPSQAQVQEEDEELDDSVSEDKPVERQSLGIRLCIDMWYV